jgi:hypothetical protein
LAVQSTGANAAAIFIRLSDVVGADRDRTTVSKVHLTVELSQSSACRRSFGQNSRLTVPVSHEKRVNVRKAGTKLVCASQPALSTVPGAFSSLFVNTYGFAYFAFTQQEWELKASQCKTGAEIQLANINQRGNVVGTAHQR